MTTNLDYLFEKLFEFSENNEGVPVFAVAYKTNIKKPKIFSSNLQIKNNELRDIPLFKKYKNHAEYICIKNLKDNKILEVGKKYKNWNLIISIPPCKFCKYEIDKIDFFRNIFYLIDYKQKFKINDLDPARYKKFIPQSKIQEEVIKNLEERFIIFHKKNYGDLK